MIHCFCIFPELVHTAIFSGNNTGNRLHHAVCFFVGLWNMRGTILPTKKLRFFGVFYSLWHCGTNSRIFLYVRNIFYTEIIGFIRKNTRDIFFCVYARKKCHSATRTKLRDFYTFFAPQAVPHKVPHKRFTVILPCRFQCFHMESQYLRCLYQVIS